MSASLTSGTYHEPALTGAVRTLTAGLFGLLGRLSGPRAVTVAVRDRVREADEVRELARSVERHSPGFAADLYAAALRHESLDD